MRSSERRTPGPQRIGGSPPSLHLSKRICTSCSEQPSPCVLLGYPTYPRRECLGRRNVLTGRLKGRMAFLLEAPQPWRDRGAWHWKVASWHLRPEGRECSDGARLCDPPAFQALATNAAMPLCRLRRAKRPATSGPQEQANKHDQIAKPKTLSSTRSQMTHASANRLSCSHIEKRCLCESVSTVRSKHLQKRRRNNA